MATTTEQTLDSRLRDDFVSKFREEQEARIEQVLVDWRRVGRLLSTILPGEVLQELPAKWVGAGQVLSMSYMLQNMLPTMIGAKVAEEIYKDICEWIGELIDSVDAAR